MKRRAFRGLRAALAARGRRERLQLPAALVHGVRHDAVTAVTAAESDAAAATPSPRPCDAAGNPFLKLTQRLDKCIFVCLGAIADGGTAVGAARPHCSARWGGRTCAIRGGRTRRGSGCMTRACRRQWQPMRRRRRLCVRLRGARAASTHAAPPRTQTAPALPPLVLPVTLTVVLVGFDCDSSACVRARSRPGTRRGRSRRRTPAPLPPQGRGCSTRCSRSGSRGRSAGGTWSTCWWAPAARPRGPQGTPSTGERTRGGGGAHCRETLLVCVCVCVCGGGAGTTFASGARAPRSRGLSRRPSGTRHGRTARRARAAAAPAAAARRTWRRPRVRIPMGSFAYPDVLRRYVQSEALLEVLRGALAAADPGFASRPCLVLMNPQVPRMHFRMCIILCECIFVFVSPCANTYSYLCFFARVWECIFVMVRGGGGGGARARSQVGAGLYGYREGLSHGELVDVASSTAMQAYMGYVDQVRAARARVFAWCARSPLAPSCAGGCAVRGHGGGRGSTRRGRRGRPPRPRAGMERERCCSGDGVV